MTTALQHRRIDTPIGTLTLVASGDGLRSIHFDGDVPQEAPSTPNGANGSSSATLDAAADQLEEYFAGTRTDFDLTLDPAGTAFQLEAWQALQTIPYGETRSYGEQAEAIGRPGAARAVGSANGQNPIPIVVPCHRVVGADGSLTGFAGGLEIKRFLLDLERDERSLPGMA